MTPAERERRHRSALNRIDRVQVVAGRADRARVDHEATLLERARMMDDELCAYLATERALAAFDRLLRLAESGDAAAPGAVAFIDCVWNRKPLPLGLLLSAGQRAGDAMLEVLDGLRHGRLDVASNVPGGARRVVKVLHRAAATCRA